jgi:hypothetical protein
MRHLLEADCFGPATLNVIGAQQLASDNGFRDG